MTRFPSWGRYPQTSQCGHYVYWPDDVARIENALAAQGCGTSLAYGNGRSYGDSCQAVSEQILAMRPMDKLVSADWSSGLIVAQTGLTLAELIRVALPRGWFLPVTPGTQFVTLGGAVANDVHGKNHHVMGTFGCHINRLWMYRSDEGLVECAPTQRSELFAATVGGLGMTGVILAVELQLRPVASSEIQQHSIRFGGLDEFFDLSNQHDATYEYTVAWIDCLAKGRQAGRGHFIAGNHAGDGALAVAPQGGLTMPVNPPFSLVNPLTLRPFNAFYYHRHRETERYCRVAYKPFFYPLDGLLQWNRMYGRKGFQQFQCVVPKDVSAEVIRALLGAISASGAGSFLAVLKQCGSVLSPGLLSFPMPGVSLALDFPQREAINGRLFARLDALVHEAGGRLYPAKDAHMSAQHFQQAYPLWTQVEQLRDRQLMSKFWRRVTQ